MRNREDINKYNTVTGGVNSTRTEGEFSRAASGAASSVGSMIWKTIKTILFIILFTGIIVFISVMSYILSFRDEEPPRIDLVGLNYTSHVYTTNAAGETTEYLALHDVEDRIAVTYDELPQHMIDAMVAIEDKRFWEHDGVDWKTTAGAVYKLITGSGDGGGSTITQQLIKNITKESQVSILRKIREIFMALNMEKKYEKQEILLAYLNIVNFGSDTQGVGAAAKLYFDKTISECDIAECASIAGITQYPYLYTPLMYKDNNRTRQRIVIDAMYDQDLISKDEYDIAMEKSNHMEFVGWQYDEETDRDVSGQVWNWYMELILDDLVGEVAEYMNCSRDEASRYIYRGGLQIYSAMDVKLQEGLEDLCKNEDILPDDPEVNFGYFAQDYNGRVLGVVGSRKEKTGNLWWSNATDAKRPTGSSIKPISVYAPALEEGLITYGKVLKDTPIPNYFGDGKSGPGNFSGSYRTTMNVDKAVEMSQNAPAAWIIKEMTPEVAFSFLQDKLHFKNLDPARDIAYSTMALGGLTNGATVREMTAAFQIFGNSGVYNKPYTYYYVRDKDNNVIIDHRDQAGEQVMSAENATVMNKLLLKPIYGEEATAYQLADLDVEIFGKTGTTDDMYDIWFVGGTPTFVAGIWNGYEEQRKLYDTNSAKVMWKAICQYFLDNYHTDNSGYKLSDNVSEHIFCRSSGYLAGSGCYNTSPGWYSNSNIPKRCNGGSDHISGSASPAASASPSAAPSPSIAPSPSENPSQPSSGLESSLPSGGESSGGESSTIVEPTPPVDITPEPPITPTPPVETPQPAETPTPPPVESNVDPNL